MSFVVPRTASNMHQAHLPSKNIGRQYVQQSDSFPALFVGIGITGQTLGKKVDDMVPN